jgi:hypothetical protein
MLKEKQKQHFNGKARQCRYIKHNEVLKETFDAFILYTIVPYKEIGT